MMPDHYLRPQTRLSTAPLLTPIVPGKSWCSFQEEPLPSENLLTLYILCPGHTHRKLVHLCYTKKARAHRNIEDGV